MFDLEFQALTGYMPMSWQRRLFAEYFEKGQLPATVDIPTGLGKTAIIAIWILALAHHARTRAVSNFPRRLVYVVNRRSAAAAFSEARVPRPH